jgi:flavin reductase (DIM6/NTAB) family NADH-FMN oxidoreductase RutF
MREFRQALGQFATGVAIVSAAGKDGKLIGMTVSSFNAVSLEPPLVLFSVSRRAFSLGALSAAKGYAVNVLSEAQQHLSTQFARPHAEKWQAVDYRQGPTGAPIIAGAIAHFECEPYAEYDGGDHVIFVGRVVRFQRGPSADPLLFFRGRYRSLHPEQPAEDWPLPIHY